MKKAEWLRKAVKRKLKERDKGVVDFIWIMRHFFGHLRDWIEEMEDPRHSSYPVRSGFYGTDEKHMLCWEYASDGRSVQ